MMMMMMMCNLYRTGFSSSDNGMFSRQVTSSDCHFCTMSFPLSDFVTNTVFEYVSSVIVVKLRDFRHRQTSSFLHRIRSLCSSAALLRSSTSAWYSISRSRSPSSFSSPVCSSCVSFTSSLFCFSAAG